MIEEQKVAALVTGSQDRTSGTCKAILKACVNCEGSGDDCFDPEKNPVLQPRDQGARARTTCRTTIISRVIQFAKQGYKDIEFPIYDTDWDSEAYLTVSGPELQQLRARHRRLPQSGREPTATGI